MIACDLYHVSQLLVNLHHYYWSGVKQGYWQDVIRLFYEKTVSFILKRSLWNFMFARASYISHTILTKLITWILEFITFFQRPNII